MSAADRIDGSAADPCGVCGGGSIPPGADVALCPAHWDAWDELYGDGPGPTGAVRHHART